MLFGFSEAFRVGGAAICLLLAAALIRDHPRDRSARASAFLLAGVVAHLLLPVELRLASAEDLPYPDGCFDKVLCVHTLYFWREPERVLAEIRRVLTPAGRLVLAWRHDREALRSFPASIYRFHDQDGVRRLLSSAGFGVPRFVERAHGGALLHFAVVPRD